MLAAIGIGVALAGPPVAALNIWLNGAVERQGRAELDLAAQRHMALSEAHIARALATLEELVIRGIDSCRVANVEARRQTTFATIPVKELSIVATDGRTLCTDVGNQPEQRKVVTSEPLSADSRTMLELVRLGGQAEPWLRIRRPATGTGNGVAALIPVRIFVAQGGARGRPVELGCPHADHGRHGDRRDGRNNTRTESRRQHRHRYIVQPLRDPGDHIRIGCRSCCQPARPASTGHCRHRTSRDSHPYAVGRAAAAPA